MPILMQHAKNTSQKSGNIFTALFYSRLLKAFLSISFFLNMDAACAITSDWTGAAADGDIWATPGNWSNGVPQTSTDTAVFGLNSVSIALNAPIDLAAIQFNGQANTIDNNNNVPGDALAFYGIGVVNNNTTTSSIINNLFSNSEIAFLNSSSASAGTGAPVMYNNYATGVGISFAGSSTAGNGLFL